MTQPSPVDAVSETPGSSLEAVPGNGGGFGVWGSTSEPPLECATEGCDRTARTRGWCQRHYEALKRTGQIRAVRSTVPFRQALADDVDEAVVERLVAGDAVPYHSYERREAVRRLRERRLTQLQIAHRLRIQPRQVARDLRRLGLTSPRSEAGVA